MHNVNVTRPDSKFLQVGMPGVDNTGISLFPPSVKIGVSELCAGSLFLFWISGLGTGLPSQLPEQCDIFLTGFHIPIKVGLIRECRRTVPDHLRFGCHCLLKWSALWTRLSFAESGRTT